MAYKLLGEAVTNPSDEDFNGATLVYVVASTAQLLTVKKADSSVIGTIRVLANSSIEVVKKASHTITCGSSICTPIAYHW